MNQALVLLARTPNGDAAFVRLGDGAVWMLDPYRARLSCEEDVRRAIRDLDFVEVGSTHSDLGDIERTLDEVAATWRKNRLWPGVKGYSVETLIEILDDVEEFGGDHQDLALTLLVECPAAKEEVVFQRILALLRRRPATTTAFTTPANAVARERVLQRLVA